MANIVYRPSSVVPRIIVSARFPNIREITRSRLELCDRGLLGAPRVRGMGGRVLAARLLRVEPGGRRAFRRGGGGRGGLLLRLAARDHTAVADAFLLENHIGRLGGPERLNADQLPAVGAERVQDAAGKAAAALLVLDEG